MAQPMTKSSGGGKKLPPKSRTTTEDNGKYKQPPPSGDAYYLNQAFNKPKSSGGGKTPLPKSKPKVTSYSDTVTSKEPAQKPLIVDTWEFNKTNKNYNNNDHFGQRVQRPYAL